MQKQVWGESPGIPENFEEMGGGVYNILWSVAVLGHSASWSLVVAKGQGGSGWQLVTPCPRPPVPREAPPVQAAQVRRMIRKEDVVRYGATEGCRRCRMLERGLDEGHREAGHGDECKTRMEAMIRGDPAQRQRLEAADRRRD